MLLHHNGPAIKGGCVTRRPSGQVMLFFSGSIVTVGTEGMARVFAVQVQSILSYTSVAVQGQKVTRSLTRYTIKIEGNCAIAV